jgi:Flp pilus assembly protein TadG
MANALRTLQRLVARPLADEAGVAAVEMAFVGPVALAFLSLAFAGGQGLSIYHKTVLTADIVTDIVARSPYSPDANINNAEQLASGSLDADLALGQLVFYPDDAGNLQIVMTELKVTSPTTATVVWSEGYNGGVALSCGVTLTLDPKYTQAGETFLLYGQASYSYQPLGVSLNLPVMSLSASDMLTIRNATQITVPNAQINCTVN